MQMSENHPFFADSDVRDLRVTGHMSPEDRVYPGESGLLVISAQWHHPFPFRTRKLNAAAPMIVLL